MAGIRVRFWPAVLAFALLTPLGALAAEPSAADKETARSLMDQGDKAMDAKDYEAALKAYQGAHSIMNVPTTGLEVARALVALGRLIEARDAALSVTRIASAAREPSAFAKARKDAQELADKLAPRIPSVQIAVSGAPAGAAVTIAIDGTAIPAAAAGVPRKTNPGAHVVTATAEGFAEAKAEVTLAEGETKSVTLTLVPGTSSAGAPSSQPTTAPASPGAAATAPQPEVDSGSGGGTSPLVFIGFGVGAAGIVVGGVTGAMSLSKASAAKENCNGNLCTAAAQDDIDSSKSLATISNIGFAVGIVGVGVGIYGLLSSGPSHEKPVAAGARLSPLIGPAFVGIDGEF